MKDFINKYYLKFCILLMIISIIPFIVISIYDRQSSDDFLYSANTYHLIQSGKWNIFSLLKTAFETDLEFYNKWQGLYVSAFLLSLQPGIFNEKLYGIGAVAMMALIFVAIYCFVKSAFAAYKIKVKPLFPALLIYTLVLQGMPSPLQGLYWFNGVWNYMTFMVMAIINMGAVIRFFNEEENEKRLLIISCILSFLISGGNHVTSFMNILLLLFAFVLSFFYEGKKKIGLSLFFAVFGFGVMLIAPGTRVRMLDYAGEGPGFVVTIINTFHKFISNLFVWSDLKWLVYMLLIIPFTARFKDNEVFKHFKLHPIIVILVFAAVICGMMATPYYAFRSFGSGRVKNMYYIAYVLFTGIALAYTLIYYARRYQKINKLLDKAAKFNMMPLVLVATIVICFASANTISVSDDIISGRAARFAKENDDRFEVMRHAGKDEVVIFEPLSDCKNLKFVDLSNDINVEVNTWWEGYFGIKAMVPGNEVRDE